MGKNPDKSSQQTCLPKKCVFDSLCFLRHAYLQGQGQYLESVVEPQDLEHFDGADKHDEANRVAKEFVDHAHNLESDIAIAFGLGERGQALLCQDCSIEVESNGYEGRDDNGPLGQNPIRLPILLLQLFHLVELLKDKVDQVDHEEDLACQDHLAKWIQMVQQSNGIDPPIRSDTTTGQELGHEGAKLGMSKD